MNITMIYGSPRKNGNSDKLGNAFAKGVLKDKLNEFYIRDLSIHGCIGCESCYSFLGKCAQIDDMQSIYDSLYNTDCIVFVTPVYYQGFPGQMKQFIDRLYISENKPFPIKYAVLLATYATEGKQMSKELRNYYLSLIKYHGWENKGIIFVDGMDEIEDINNSGELTKAFELAKKITKTF